MLNFVFPSDPKTLEPQSTSSKEILQPPLHEVICDSQNIKVIRPQKSIINSLLQQAESIIPRYNNFKKQLLLLEDKLSSCFVDEEINLYPAIDISMDFENNYVNVSGERDDLVKIESLLNEISEIRKMIQQVCAIGSHIINIADSVAFREEYYRSDCPDKVIAKYNELFNDYRRMKEFSLRFDNGLTILCDRELWSFPVNGY